MNFQLMSLKKNIYKVPKLPKDMRLFIVVGTRLIISYVVPPIYDAKVFRTRNAAKRAIARYRQTSLDYEYATTYFKGFSKNISKYLSFAFDKAFEEFKSKTINYDLGAKTVKICRIECDGLMDYKRIKE